MKTRILFICKSNRFRSRVAEAIFLKYNHNKEIDVKSAGVRPDPLRPYVAKSVKLAMKEKNFFISDAPAKLADNRMIRWADKIIVVADNVLPELFPAEKTDVWPVSDADESEYKKIKTIIHEIEQRIKVLVASLKV